jgi:DNA invertase Pin-like site-specific DNA recombinase
MRCTVPALTPNRSAILRTPSVSGLGIEAQRDALARFAATEGFEVAGEFTEVETGKGADALDRRPQLAAALADARRRKCPIAVAKLDRLSRDVHFISGLMTHRVPFIVAETLTCSRWIELNLAAFDMTAERDLPEPPQKIHLALKHMGMLKHAFSER